MNNNNNWTQFWIDSPKIAIKWRNFIKQYDGQHGAKIILMDFLFGTEWNGTIQRIQI